MYVRVSLPKDCTKMYIFCYILYCQDNLYNFIFKKDYKYFYKSHRMKSE